MKKSTNGPSRIRNKRQEKIVSMVDGYDSTVSVSTGLRNVLLVWVLIGIALMVIGFAGLLTPARSEFARETFNDTLLAIRVGAGLLGLVTTITSIVWAVRTWSNIRRLGKRAHIGAWAVLKRHFAFFIASVAMLVVSIFSESLRLPLLIMAGVSFYLAASFVPFLVLALIRLFWRSGSPPIGLEEELPHYGLIWFVSWFAYSSLNGAGEYSGFTMQTVSIIVVVEGFCCVVAAVTGAKLVVEISERHDVRLGAIVSGLDLDDDEQQEVTSRQIESAWADSETLVSFDHS